MTRFVLALTAIAVTFGVGAASAGTIQDLAGLGYTVSISNPGPSGQNCPTYYITGHGVGTYMNCNTSQAEIDSLANPAVICNADWQAAHPDQLAAFQAIVGKGYSVSGDQCADTYTVTAAGTTFYSGPGAGLPAQAAKLGTAPTAAGAQPGTGTETCLPLCSGTTSTATTTTATGGAATPTSTTTTTTSTATSGTTTTDTSVRWAATRVAA